MACLLVMSSEEGQGDNAHVSHKDFLCSSSTTCNVDRTLQYSTVRPAISREHVHISRHTLD
jgi:hypothetical protein